MNEDTWRVADGILNNPADRRRRLRWVYVYVMTLCEVRSTEKPLHDVVGPTTNLWIRRLQHFQKHCLEHTYGIVVTSCPVQSCMLPLVAPRRRWIERDHL